VVILATGVRSLLAVVPDQPIVRVITGAIGWAATFAELTGLAVCPVLRGVRNRVNLGTGFRRSGSNGARVSGKRREEFNAIGGRRIFPSSLC